MLRIPIIGTMIDQLDAQLDHAEGDSLRNEVRKQRKDYVTSFLSVSEHLSANQDDEASHLMLVETLPHLDSLKVSLESLITMQEEALREARNRSLQVFKTTYRLWTWFFAAAVLAALVLSVWIIHAVIRPLGRQSELARAVVERIARGDLDSPIPLGTGDCDSLLIAMKTMQGNLRQLIEERDRVECALRDSTQRFQGLVETLRDWVWEVDTDWCYSYVSPQVRGILGYTPEEILGKTPFDLMPPEEASRIRSVVEALQPRRKPIVALENINLHKSGLRVVLESSGQPYFDKQGNFRGYRGVDREITDRKQAEKARLAEAERLRDALVREVHHRIKNNLQTVVGLLRREADKRPEARASIEAAIAQVKAVAVVHGLYGQAMRHSVLLCELVPAVVGSVSELTGVQIRLAGIGKSDGHMLIRESETVAVALVLNELVTNAVKHSTGVASASIPQVALWREGRSCGITIKNVGRLEPGFDFDSCRGLGTGLGLVRALIPVPGMSVRFRQSGEDVRVNVVIEAPVLGDVPHETPLYQPAVLPTAGYDTPSESD
ncbi:MAG: PAS domain S-box protein [Methyloversatilis sp.]|uniref:PAS domain S-box protein n=1 Tax=Methyloversatilis sp. TaxID=2569862 RepID=UPI002736EBFC|nr:PAS domain S-box protein [Methyloversatilis sp.]MDP3872024.1 PAS domain S-box protein [Methyloversatilis sp.]